MAKARRLQQEVEQTLKRVQEVRPSRYVTHGGAGACMGCLHGATARAAPGQLSASVVQPRSPAAD